MNTQITDYINHAPTDQKQILVALRKLIHESVPNVREEFKWSRPVFRSDRDFAYLKTAKSHVILGFFNFKKLDDPQERLEGTGKDMRHVKIRTMDDIDSGLFKKWLASSAE